MMGSAFGDHIHRMGELISLSWPGKKPTPVEKESLVDQGITYDEAHGYDYGRTFATQWPSPAEKSGIVDDLVARQKVLIDHVLQEARMRDKQKALRDLGAHANLAEDQMQKLMDAMSSFNNPSSGSGDISEEDMRYVRKSLGLPPDKD